MSHPARLFAALGDETRLRVVARLADEGPSSITSLTSAVDVSRQAVTKHLRVLEDAGLVQSESVGRERIWRMRPERLHEAHTHLDRIAARWDAALDRLRSAVEAE